MVILIDAFLDNFQGNLHRQHLRIFDTRSVPDLIYKLQTEKTSFENFSKHPSDVCWQIFFDGMDRHTLKA